MKEGDYIVCKKDLYADSGNTFFSNFLNKFLRSPFLKKGKKYKIDKIEKRTIYLYLTKGGGYTTTPIAGGSTYLIDFINYRINGKIISDDTFRSIFYTIQEERKMKLKKIKE